MRFLLLLFSSLLCACSMEAMSEKRVPDDVRAEVSAQIDRLIASDTGFIFDSFPEERDNPEFREQIARMIANVPDGDETARHVVGVIGSTEQAYSDAQGTVRRGTYNLAYELVFEDDYLLVQTAHTLTDDGDCCVLRAINASRSDTSLMREDQVRRARLFKFLTLFLLISSVVTALVLIIRIGKRKARETQMGG